MLVNERIDISDLTFTDTQFYIWLAHDAVQADRGGPPLKLKDYAHVI